MAQTIRKADAFSFPRSYPNVSGEGRKSVAIKHLFGPSLGSARVEYRHHLNNQQTLASRFSEKDVTWYHPHGHPSQGQDRYEWHLAEQGSDGIWVPVAPVTGADGEDERVKIGYLLDDLHATDPETAKAVNAALDAKIEEYRTSPAYLLGLVKAGILSPDALPELPEAALANAQANAAANGAGSPPASVAAPTGVATTVAADIPPPIVAVPTSTTAPSGLPPVVQAATVTAPAPTAAVAPAPAITNPTKPS